MNNTQPINITLLGLGPGDPNLLTMEGWNVLNESKEVYLRTNLHPAVAGFPKHLVVHSFDSLYENTDRFEDVYTRIVNEVIELGKRPGGVVYGVPGHPFVAEATSIAINNFLTAAGYKCRVVQGISFFEPVLTLLGVDPFPKMIIVDALELVTRHTPPFPSDHRVLIGQLYSRQIAAEVKMTLLSVYPEHHVVKLVHAAGSRENHVEEMCLYEIDRSKNIGTMTTLYLPALPDDTSFEAFQEVIARLRAPDGCPWDREQDHQSLRPYLMEETYELLQALDDEEPRAICEELGDLLLQIMLHAQVAGEDGSFNMVDVLQGIHRKIVSRHPHVFGDISVAGSQDVLRNWEVLKAAERAADGKAMNSLLDSVPKALPALNQAEQFQRRVARVGFDWENIEGVKQKIYEELDELQTAVGKKNQTNEIGDLLFAIVNIARWLDIDAESALRETNVRFKHRISHVESVAHDKGKKMTDLSPSEMDSLWEDAKRAEDLSSDQPD